MKSYATLQELLQGDAQSRQLFDRLTPDQQTALQEQRQNIRTRQELELFAAASAKQTQNR